MAYNKRNRPDPEDSSVSERSEISFVVHSGATGHMVNDIKTLSNLKLDPAVISTAQKGVSIQSPLSKDLVSTKYKLHEVRTVPARTNQKPTIGGKLSPQWNVCAIQ